MVALPALGLPSPTISCRCDLDRGNCVSLVHALHTCICNDHGCLYDFPLHFVRAAYSFGCLDLRSNVDRNGSLETRPLVSATSCAECYRLRGLNHHRYATTSSTVSLGCRWSNHRTTRSMVWLCAPPFPRSTEHVNHHAGSYSLEAPLRIVYSRWLMGDTQLVQPYGS